MDFNRFGRLSHSATRSDLDIMLMPVKDFGNLGSDVEMNGKSDLLSKD